MALGGTLGLGIVLTASDLASGAIKSVAKSFAGLDDSVTKAQEKFAAKLGKNFFGGLGMEPTVGILKDLGKASAVAALGVSGLAAAFKLADSTAEFELRLEELRNSTKLTSDQVDDFERRALELGVRGPFGPMKTADAFRELASSTLTGNQALRALQPTLDILGASFGRLSPEQAGGLVAKTLEAFPELANNATHAVDLLARAFKGGLKPEEIARAMERAARGEKFLGNSLEEVLTTLGGAKGAGLQVGRLSEQILRNVNYTEKFQVATQRMQKALGDVSVTAHKGAEAFAGTWEGLKASVSSATEVLSLEIGKPFREVLAPIFSTVVSGIRSVVTWVANLSPHTKKLFAQFVVFGSVALILGGVKMALAAIIPVAGAVLASIAPVVATGAAIAAAAYLIYKAWETNFGGIRDVVEPIFDSVKLAVESLVELFTKGEITGALADDLLKAENGPIFDFVEGVSRLAANVRNAWADVGPDVIKVFTGIKTVAEPILSGILSATGSTLKAIAGLIEVTVGLLSGNLNTVTRGLTLFVNAGIDMVNGLISTGARALRALGSEKGADYLETLKMKNVTAPQLAAMFGNDARALELKDEDDRRAAARAASSGAGVPSSASATGTTSGLPSSVASTTLPSSRPSSAGSDSGASEAALLQLAAAIEKSTQKQAVVVNGTIEIDGMKFAEWQARSRRDAAAIKGTIHQPFHHAYPTTD